MRYLIPALLVTALFTGCSESKKNGTFELKGKLENTNNETIYLDQLASAQPQTVDSAEIDSDGNFEFVNHKPTVGFYRIRQSQQNFAMFVLDSNDRVMVTGNLADLGNTYKVEGSDETKLFVEYNNMVRSRDMRLDSINSIAQVTMEQHRADAKKLDSLTRSFEKPFNEIHEETNRRLEEKILANTDKFSSIMAVQSLEPDQYAHVYKKLAEGLSKKFPQQSTVKMFSDYVTGMLQTAAGNEAPDITLPSTDDKTLSLSDYRGKIVLIDFWASWCGPCRRENPNVVKMYNRFKSKGFEIFGVSLDQDRAKWVEAIGADNITWPQVSDLKGWQSSAARLYNVQAIPYTVLVDRQGVILAKNLRGEELERKLEEVLSQQDGSEISLN